MIFSLFNCLVTLFLQILQLSPCSVANLQVALSMISIQNFLIFGFLIVQQLGFGKRLKKCKRCLDVIYIYICATQFFVAMVLSSRGKSDFWHKDDDTTTPEFSKDTEFICFYESPFYAFWLLFQCFVFYFMILVTLIRWANYICFQAEVQEQENQEALDRYIKQRGE